MYGFYLYLYEQRMDEGGCFPGKQFFCEAVWGTMSSQCGTLPKRPVISIGRVHLVGQKM